MNSLFSDTKREAGAGRNTIKMIAGLLFLIVFDLSSQCLPYLGQTSPGNVPVRLVPDTMAANTDWQYHGTPAFSPEGDEMYYAIYRFNPGRVEIWFTKCLNGKWTSPTIAPFSNLNYTNNNPVFSKHKDTLYFFSPRSGGFIHRVVRSNGEWNSPVALNLRVPQGYVTGLQFSIADNGNVYAELSAQGSKEDIYVWRLVNGTYQSPEKITAICSPELDFTPFIDPAEKFIMFCSRRPGGFGNTDIYISKRNLDNTWSSPVNVGQAINTGDVISPIISRDGRYLLFEAWVQGASGGNPYWVKAETVTRLIGDSTVTDIDGNVYHTVVIGTQTWMIENLKTTKLLNGDPIPNIADNSQWSGLTTGAYCNYGNNAANGVTYGHLYNWHAVNDARKIAPAGWHVPTKDEWNTLFNYLGGINVAGGKLKETGTTHWASPNTGATNEAGFSALPGGYRETSASYIGIGNLGSWWCATQNNAAEAWAVGIFSDAAHVDLGWYYDKKIGFSVRCVKDESPNKINDNSRPPLRFNLQQNYPNPFNPSTNICFSLSENTPVTLKVYNMLGREIVTLLDREPKAAGYHQLTLKMPQAASGVYFCRLDDGKNSVMKNILYLK